MSVDLDPDVPGLTGRIGGPLGKRVRPGGLWFNPVPWALGAGLFSWLVLMLRQVPCIPSSVTEAPNNYLRLCYSDIPILFRNRDSFWQGLSLYTPTEKSIPLEYPPLTGALIWVSRTISEIFTGAFPSLGTISPTATPEQQLSAAYLFFGVNSILLFALFLATIAAHLEMARKTSGGLSERGWDALFIAAAPAVMASGLINWDLLAVGLCSLGLLLWARKKPGWSGVLIGLACAAKFYPLALIPVLLLLCLRADRFTAFSRFFGGALASWLAVNLPLMLTNYDGWAYFWTYNTGRSAELGSLWYLLQLFGLTLPNVSVIEICCITLGGAAIMFLTLSAPSRPRVGQLAFLVLVVFLVSNKVYSPQYMLWLLPLLVLARPRIIDIGVFSIAEVGYYCAIWGHLEGVLGPGQNGEPIYWLAILLRIGVQIWLAVRVVDDILHPWNDPVRTPFVDDPIGGVLNHAPDAPWMYPQPKSRRTVAAAVPGSAVSAAVPVAVGGAVPVAAGPVVADAADATAEVAATAVSESERSE